MFILKYIIVGIIGIVAFIFIKNEVPRIDNKIVKQEIKIALEKQLKVLDIVFKSNFKGTFENIKEINYSFLESREYTSDLILFDKDSNKSIDFSNPRIVITIDKNSTKNIYEQKDFSVKIYDFLPLKN